MRRVDLRSWLHKNPWECEDGPSVLDLRACDHHWDGPRCFADARTLVTWGFGNDIDFMVDAAVVHDVETGRRLRWFAGPPRGRFLVDEQLIVVTAAGTTVWDLESGERIHEAIGFVPRAFHPESRNHLSFNADGAWTLSQLRS